ncbi:MAG: threonine/serine dehydratase [Paracoccaceae bacterium]|nr:threonine/serine dehydratase [Paracoccaceae bacterium]
MSAPDIASIEAAATRLDGHAVKTPLLHSPFLDEIAGRRVLVKAEALQKTGSFKYRGARAALTALGPEEAARGVLAMSSGNHAQGVALAARELGISAQILMPSDAPALKLANTRAYGAEVVTYDRASEDRDGLARTLAETEGRTLIPPYDHPEVMAGQGTAGLEIAADAAALGVTEAEVAVCCGGGGLISGIALALEARAPGLKVRPAEPEGFDDMARSLASGGRETNNRTAGSLQDAILTPSPGRLTFEVLRRLAGPGLVVSDDEALRAMALAFSRLKLVLEPGGATALAAALFCPDAFASDTVIAVATGGNVDPGVFQRALAQLS